MASKRNTLVKDSQDNVEVDMLDSYEALDIEDDIFYQYNPKTYYGAKSAYVDHDDYDFDNYDYRD
jgi:hypothetical protein